MPDITLRHAVEADLPAIVAIYNAAVPTRIATADTQPVTLEQRRPWFHEHTPGRRPLLVAESHGRVVGFLSFRNFYGRPAYHATAEIGSYIDPDFHRAGIGSALLAEALRIAPALGLRTLLAFIFAHNAPSLGLVAKFGFQQWGRLPGVAELDGHRRDLVIMGKTL